MGIVSPLVILLFLITIELWLFDYVVFISIIVFLPISDNESPLKSSFLKNLL